MTDAMLRLARAVYPDKPWQVDEERTIPFLGNGMYFYPEHFDSQFIDTLAWLLRTGEACVLFDSVEVLIFDQATEVFLHDGTASGIRRAVVEAARRVVA